jgi:hypothetical protein
MAVFILTHGRADRVHTYKTLRTHGYTGKIYLVIDDEDDQEQAYRELYGDQVVQFCKEEYLRKSMCINPDKPRKVILYARNACFDIARQLGITHFVEMDDDYSAFGFRFERNGRLRQRDTRNLDDVITAFFDFLECSHSDSIAFSQGGDLLGGISGDWAEMRLKRKAMNSFFCITEKPVNFVGAINEDVNTYVSQGNIGRLFFSVLRFILIQSETQKNTGGMSETYLDNGTYVKTFPTVMLNPSCVKVAAMRSTNARIHHKISWKNAVPKILNEKYRKQREG